MGKFMGHYYQSRTTYDLNVLRSKKYNRIVKLQHKAWSYLDIQELKRLKQQIMWIDAELAARANQIALF